MYKSMGASCSTEFKAVCKYVAGEPVVDVDIVHRKCIAIRRAGTDASPVERARYVDRKYGLALHQRLNDLTRRLCSKHEVTDAKLWRWMNVMAFVYGKVRIFARGDNTLERCQALARSTDFDEKDRLVGATELLRIVSLAETMYMSRSSILESQVATRVERSRVGTKGSHGFAPYPECFD
jgi:hypothetical protein